LDICPGTVSADGPITSAVPETMNAQILAGAPETRQSIGPPSLPKVFSLVKSLRTKAFLVQFEAVSNREKTVVRFTALRNSDGYRASSHVVPPAL